MDYQTARDGSIYVTIPVAKGKLALRGDAVRKERTGVHARVEIWWHEEHKTRLSSDLFNVERQEDRDKQVRRAYKLFPPDARDAMSEDQCKMEMDTFCLGLWEAKVGTIHISKNQPGDINIPPPRMLGPYLVEHGGTLIHGQPKAGKSWMLYLICQSVNHGRKTLWPVRKQERVLLINLERSESSVQQRLGCINRALGLPLNAGLDILHRRGGTLKEVMDAARRHVERNDIGVVALDSVSRAGLGSLNNDDIGNEAIDMLNRLCPTWIALTHEKKLSTDDLAPTVFGSQMFSAGADLIVPLSSRKGGGNLYVTMHMDRAGSNVAISQEPEHYLLEMDQLGLVSVQTGGKLRTVAEVHAYMEEYGECWAGPIAVALDCTQQYVSSVLLGNPELFTHIFTDDMGRKYYKAV